MKYINKFNTWYDGLPGTPRFLLFISVMAVAIFSLQLGPVYAKPWVTLFGLSIFSMMCFVACVRATNMGSMHRVVAWVLGGLMVLFFAMTLVVVFK